jgi:cytochrome c oxidase assembly factor CtaG
MMWDWEPSVVVGCAVFAGIYLTGARPRTVRQVLWFSGGVLLLLLDLVSPIDALGDTYLFSAHVLQHFLLAMIIPPLWLLGTPRHFAEGALRYSWIQRIECAVARPAVAWPLGIGTMLAWHIPALFNAALASEPVHIFQHLSFLVTGTIFWWPILGPMVERRMAPLPAIAYLFSACTACSLLGAVLTFTAPGSYPAYLHPDDRLGILRMIRTGWGIDAQTDQQLGGMLMWVPGCLVYLTAILARVARWYATPEPAARNIA